MRKKNCPSKQPRVGKMDCIIRDDDYNTVTLELAHIQALAEIADERADDNDGPAKTALMLLRERCNIINKTLSDAWERTKQAQRDPAAA